MNASTATLPPGATRALAKTELKLFLREPVGVFWTLAFPLAILIVMGSIHGARVADKDLGGVSVIATYVPILCCFALGMLTLNALPPVLAGYRERGVLRRLATTPVGAERVLGAQLAVYGSVAAIVVILVVAVARIAFSVGLPAEPLAFALVLVLTAAALFGLGLTIASAARTTRAANAVGAMSFFPLMFFAGLWIPRETMSPALRHISDGTPIGAAVASLRDASAGSWPTALHLGVLVAWAVVFGVAAIRLFRWE